MNTMKPTLKSSATVYKLSLAELKQHFAEVLSCSQEQIIIEDLKRVTSSDPMDRYPTVYGFDGLSITVKESK